MGWAGYGRCTSKPHEQRGTKMTKTDKNNYGCGRRRDEGQEFGLQFLKQFVRRINLYKQVAAIFKMTNDNDKYIHW